MLFKNGVLSYIESTAQKNVEIKMHYTDAIFYLMPFLEEQLFMRIQYRIYGQKQKKIILIYISIAYLAKRVFFL